MGYYVMNYYVILSNAKNLKILHYVQNDSGISG